MFNRLVKFSTDIAMLVSSQRRVDNKTREVLLPRAVRQTLTEAGRLAAARQLTTGVLSEISMRLPGDKLAINVNGAWFPHLSEDDFVVAALAHERTIIKSLPPSQHVNWHRWAYTSTPALAALLCQPAATVLAALKGCLPAAGMLAEMPELASDVPLVAPTDEEIQKSLVSHPVLFIQGYGLFIWGQDLFQILALAETIDLWCKVSLSEQGARGNA
jgi:ribulose-5-phosphate 4-epimerase/fuculose-1-phosphate aldolase